jgi:DNA-binding IscR family transcriptional regulator
MPGAGAGWMLSRDLASITLLDVYDVVGPSPLFGMHPATPDPQCVVGSGIQPVMRSIYDGIEDAVRNELAKVTLETVLRDVLAAP